MITKSICLNLHSFIQVSYLEEIISIQGTTNITLFCFHGAGLSKSSFSPMINAMSSFTGPENSHEFTSYIRIIAPDLRGHGQTKSEDQSFSIENLVLDGIEFIKSIAIESNDMLFLCGHSMAGAVAVQICENIPERVSGIILLDCVEEIAIKSITPTLEFLKRRPQRFSSFAEAVEWTARWRHDSKIKILEQVLTDQLVQTEEHTWIWRTDVLSSSSLIPAWFSGVSQKFADLDPTKVGKLLIVSEVETLDTPLLLGQMQGKFQVQVFNHTSHFIHEDDSTGVGRAILSFIYRYSAYFHSKRPGNTNKDHKISHTN